MKVLRIFEDAIDWIYRIIFILIMLIGLYYVYDTIYVFYNASAERYMVSGQTGYSEDVVKELTEDYVAWLSIDDTNINYPIMQGETNSSYLNTNPYGEYSLSGSIFMDSRNAYDFSDSYNLIYGHHMANNFMFGALDQFYDEEYLLAHDKGTILTKDGVEYALDIFACIKTDAEIDVIFNPQGSFAALGYIKTFELAKLPANEHLVALSTCLEPGSTTRTVVFGTIEEIGGSTNE